MHLSSLTPIVIWSLILILSANAKTKCPMMSSKAGERKRDRREMENTSSSQPPNKNCSAESDTNAAPLQGVIACLSGLAQDEKVELHQLIVSLGGRYTRDFDLDKNTHLITEAAWGAKYDLAASSNSETIHIVTPTWLTRTAETGERASEADHGLGVTKNNSRDQQPPSVQKSLAKPSVLSLLDNALSDIPIPGTQLSRSFLFEKLHFFLIGFDDNLELKQKIGRLIRRGGGIIHWEMNEDVSILLLCDTCDDSLVNAAKVVTAHHVNFPPAVSSLWVIESYHRSALQTTSAYPPMRANASQKQASDRPKSVPNRVTKASTTTNVSIFRGCLFCLVYSSQITTVELDPTKSDNRDTNIVRFDSKEQERLIQDHGGQLLSEKLLDALQEDAKSNGLSGIKRKCHIVCWGASPPRLDTNPFVSRLQRNDLCDLILVTPIWVQACASLRKRLRPDRIPLVLVPQSWSMKSSLEMSSERTGGKRGAKGTDAAASSKKQPNRRLDISLTGFQDTEKTVIIHVIRAIGGAYHGNMSSANTHLIYKKNATGLKLEKAIEWDLHVVSIQWLYHVLQHGYGGLHNDENGCEKRFALSVGS